MGITLRIKKLNKSRVLIIASAFLSIALGFIILHPDAHPAAPKTASPAYYRLLAAIDANDPLAVTTVIEQNPSCVHEHIDGKTALIVACRDHFKQEILPPGTPACICCSRDSCTPEWLRAYEQLQQNRRTIISIIIAAGADINSQDDEGRTALQHACIMCGDIKKVQLLLDAGADTTIQSNSGRTALMEAHYETRELEDLIQLYCSVNKPHNKKVGNSMNILPLQQKIEAANLIEPHYPSYIDINHYGLCLRAAKDLPQGTIVATADFEPTDKTYIAGHPSEEYKYVAVMDVTADGTPIYGKVRGKWAFCNHSCDPNCTITDTWEIVTNRAVAQGEELTTSYDAFVHNLSWQENWNFDCLCNAYSCKKIICRYRMDMVYPVKTK